MSRQEAVQPDDRSLDWPGGEAVPCAHGPAPRPGEAVDRIRRRPSIAAMGGAVIERRAEGASPNPSPIGTTGGWDPTHAQYYVASL